MILYAIGKMLVWMGAGCMMQFYLVDPLVGYEKERIDDEVHWFELIGETSLNKHLV